MLVQNSLLTLVAAEQQWVWPAAEFAAERRTAAAAFADVAPEDSAAAIEEFAAIVAEYAAFAVEFAAFVEEFVAFVAEFAAFVAAFAANVADCCCRFCHLEPKLTACPGWKSKVPPIKGEGVCRPNQPNRSAFVPRLNQQLACLNCLKMFLTVAWFIDKG